jgi:hypothetical protein
VRALEHTQSPAKPSPAKLHVAADDSFEASHEEEQKTAVQSIFATNRITVKSLADAEAPAAPEPAQASQAGVTRLGQVSLRAASFIVSKQCIIFMSSMG